MSLKIALDLLRQGNWDKAHDLAQEDSSPDGNWLHGILHFQEGDLGNAEYWYRLAGRKFRDRGTLEEEIYAFAEQLRADRPSSK